MGGQESLDSRRLPLCTLRWSRQARAHWRPESRAQLHSTAGRRRPRAPAGRAVRDQPCPAVPPPNTVTVKKCSPTFSKAPSGSAPTHWRATRLLTKRRGTTRAIRVRVTPTVLQRGPVLNHLVPTGLFPGHALFTASAPLRVLVLPRTHSLPVLRAWHTRVSLTWPELSAHQPLRRSAQRRRLNSPVRTRRLSCPLCFPLTSTETVTTRCCGPLSKPNHSERGAEQMKT